MSRNQLCSRRQVWAFQNNDDIDVYVGINTSTIPDILPNIAAPHELLYEHVCNPRYNYDRFFYISFLPEQLYSSCQTLQCLNYMDYRVVILKGMGSDRKKSYELDRQLVAQWDALWELIQGLRDLLHTRDIWTPVDMQYPPSPTLYNYHRTFRAAKTCLCVLREVRSAFFFHLSWISYLVYRHSSPEDLSQDLPRWAASALGRQTISVSVYNDLQSSWVFNLRVRRMGSFIDVMKGSVHCDEPASTQWYSELMKIIRTVPGFRLWLRYPNIVGSDAISMTGFSGSAYTLIRDTWPTADEVGLAIQVLLHEKDKSNNRLRPAFTPLPTAQSLPPSVPSTPEYAVLPEHVPPTPELTPADSMLFVEPPPSPSPLPPPLPPKPTLPSPHHPGPEMRGAAMIRYLQCLAEHNVYLRSMESPEEKAERKEREVIARRRIRKLEEDDILSMTIYRWIQVDSWDNKWSWHVHTPVFALLKGLWERTTLNQRIYDPFTDAYHVSEDLPAHFQNPLEAQDDVENRVDEDMEAIEVDEDSDEEDDIYPPNIIWLGHRDETSPLSSHSPAPSSSQTHSETMGSSSRHEARHRTRPPHHQQSQSPHPSSSRLQPVHRPSRSSSPISRHRASQSHIHRSRSPIPSGRFSQSSSQILSTASSGRLSTLEAGSNKDAAQSVHIPMTLLTYNRRPEVMLNTSTLDEILLRRYGLTAVGADFSLSPDGPLLLTEKKVGHILGDSGDYLQMGRTIPAAVCDTAPGALNLVRRFKDLPVQIKHLDEKFYLIDVHNPNDVRWQVVAHTAVDILHLLRDIINTHIDTHISRVLLARALCSNGIPFHTVLPMSSASTMSPPPVNLDICPFNYNSTVEEYYVYEARRNSILQGPRGRAALLKGGIIWRLAMETLNPDFVLSGPGGDRAHEFIINQASSYMVDDDLSVDELDIISGVYKVLNHPTGALNVSHRSWWPKFSAWQGSVQDNGHWSIKNEIWFQQRRDAILTGKAGVKTGQEWYNMLAIKREWRNVRTNMEALSKKYLDEHLIQAQ
ncbi:hypothetical protein NM688_g4826 [Phlebia brevispora]|uniref:Uncharacterized protein n=1 Tax=Phlebia brevispora TaxID=194682 RepID=A0ACC1T205_9APHY|nr:hypothetical protein NM688_g4826 [Phlebia brevispora]